jgi:ferrous iron transport protein B
MRYHIKERQKRVDRKVLLIGNPNVGKSVVFFQLTGRYVTCSNYPGTTVEICYGRSSNYEVIDTPGINTLIPSSEDEKVTRNLLIQEQGVVIQVADAKNLRRALLLTVQLAELGVPLVLDLNMADEAQNRGIDIDAKRLSQLLGVEVIKTVATTGRGIKKLKEALSNARIPKLQVDYGPELERFIGELEGIVKNRGIAVALLGDPPLLRTLSLSEGKQKQLQKIIFLAERSFSQPLHYLITRQQQAQAERITDQVSRKAPPKRSFADRLGSLTTRPVSGFLIFLGVLFLLYQFVGYVGAQVLVGLLEETLFGEYINPFIIRVVSYLPLPLLRELLAGEFGLITMALTYSLALIFPIVAVFFLAWGLLEDSGYFPRLAVMSQGIFSKIGLSGKAILPMILGLGCDTMATITTRTLETKKERVIATLLLALAVPCSAQLGVIFAMLAASSPWALALIFGIVGLQGLIVGYLAARILPGERSDFILEIPPLRLPKPSNILRKTWMRLRWYLTEVVPLFILGTFMLFVLDKLRVLPFLQDVTRPVVSGWLGLPPQAARAFLMGFLRRDYGAAGLFQLQQKGLLDEIQIVTSLVVITLFVPCIANFLVIVKERGWRVALAIVGFIIPYAILVGTLVNLVLQR